MARIRLLKVRPAKEGLNSPMELDLAVFEVETAPPYFALSYTWDAPWDGLASEWDDPNHGCMITVNDLRWGVRMNLAHALYRLRFSLLPMLTGLGEVDKNTDNVWLWIDAICINQDDPNDKAEFIGRMRDIYHRAQATLVWLGPTHEYTDFLLERFEVVQAAVRGELPALPNIQDPCSGEELSSTSDPLSEKETAYLKRLKADIFSKNAEKEWDAVIWMFKNNWWRRIWVVQEVVVAQKVYLIQGHICIAFWLLYELHQSILQHLKYFLGLEIFKGSNADGLMHVVHDASSKFLEILHLMTQSDGDRLPQFNLLETLNSLRSRSCSDDRDKIYACLGMTKQSDIVTPDYRRSVEDVYGSLTRKVIEDRKDLAVLEYCVCSIHMDGDVPSWVPDWRVSGRWSKKSLYENSLADSVGRPDGNTITRKYNAGGSEPLHATFSDDSKVLKLQVVLVDEVDFVGRSLWKEDPSIEQARAQNRKQRDEIWNKYQIKASDLAAEHAACTEKVTQAGWLLEWLRSRTELSPPVVSIGLQDLWTPCFHCSNDQFEWLEYAPTKENLYQAYLRTICADTHVCPPMSPDDHEAEVKTPDEDQPTSEQAALIPSDPDLPPSEVSASGAPLYPSPQTCSLSHPSVEVSPNKPLPSSREAASRILIGRTFLASRSLGLIGIGPEECKPGDVIAIVRGWGIPLLLRRQAEGGSLEYNLVGECYVHGLMDGELLHQDDDVVYLDIVPWDRVRTELDVAYVEMEAAGLRRACGLRCDRAYQNVIQEKENLVAGARWDDVVGEET